MIKVEDEKGEIIENIRNNYENEFVKLKREK